MSAFQETNLWKDSCANRFEFGDLDRDLDVDVAVIGGGFTGLSAALNVAQAGKSVAVLEARHIGYGGSGRNVGLVNAGLWLKPSEIIAAAGARQGTALIKFLSDAPGEVFKLIQKYDIPCESYHNGTLHCADDEKGMADLRQRQNEWRDFDVDIPIISAEETKRLTGTGAYLGALHDMRAGVIQPLAYAYGLARAAHENGAQIFESSPVTTVSKEIGCWVLSTAKGRVKARQVISATGAYPVSSDKWYTPETTTLFYFQMATEPMSADEHAQILPEKHSAWDTKSVLTSFRTDAAGRMIMGSIGKLDGMTYGGHKAWAYRKMHKLFPQLKGKKFVHEWFGRIAMTSDNIPRLAKPHDNWITVWGYNGRGIAPGTAFGKLLAQNTLDAANAPIILDFVDPKQDSFVGVQTFGIEAGAWAYHLLPSS